MHQLWQSFAAIAIFTNSKKGRNIPHCAAVGVFHQQRKTETFSFSLTFVCSGRTVVVCNKMCGNKFMPDAA